ncbi:flippase [Pedobacter frigoris]|uniref:flippase n=1 Tax=Pedobacter frigoris TaxID=2571272 RepID=UPI00292E7275|nr:flippase [Pedobacter frigoris]
MKILHIKGFDQEAFQKYLKNTGWLMFGKVLALLINILVARHLQPKSFGDLNFASALTTIIAAIGTLGLDTFIIREIISEPSKKDEILGTSLGLRIAVNLLLIPISIGIYLLFHHFSDNPGNAITWVVFFYAVPFLFRSFNIIDAYFQSQVQSKYVVHVQNIVILCSTAFKAILVWLNASLIWFAFAITFDAVLLAGGLVIIYHRQGYRLRTWTFNLDRAKTLMKQSYPLMFSAVMVSIYMKIDQVMLKSAGSLAIGIYSAAANLSEAWFFIPVAIITSVFPAIINARKTDMERYHKRMMNLYDLMVYISLPVAIFVSLFGTEITHLIYGNKYEGAGSMLSIHIWSGIFVFLGVANSRFLITEGYTHLALQSTAIGALINILLNIWLIPQYGGIGTSIATLVAYAASAFYVLLIPKTRHQGILMLKSLFLVHLIQKISQKPGKTS